tara:strand:+ start:406 stop:636 length:231 start_codon:yes stop_codon:yes gene_type:complete
VSKKLKNLQIDECAVGDVCYMVKKQFRKPLYGEITKIFVAEQAIQILTNVDGFRTAHVEQCFWNESDAKEHKKTQR